MRILLALAVAALLALPAAARPLTPAETEALAKSVNDYLSAIGRGDAQAIVSALPPRMLNVFAGATGVEAAKLETTLVDQTKAMMKGTKFRDLRAGTSKANAHDEVLSDGSAVTWALLPTVFLSVSKGKESRHEQPLLALREGDAWYFLRIEGPQSQQLAAIAYPFLADVTFPPASAAAVK